MIWDFLLWCYLSALVALPSVLIVPALAISYAAAIALGFLLALPFRTPKSALRN